MTAVTVARVEAALDGVPDPELAPLSVRDLGIVVDVRVTGRDVEVDLVPTFTGCPATQVIREDVERAVRALPGVGDVRVAWVATPTWSPARISQAGRERLRAFGVSMHDGCPHCAATRTVEDSAFGPTPCRAVRFCEDCRNPFEAMK